MPLDDWSSGRRTGELDDLYRRCVQKRIVIDRRRTRDRRTAARRFGFVPLEDRNRKLCDRRREDRRKEPA